MQSFEEFKNLAQQGNIVPLFEELIADTETPISVYLKVKKESPYSFLLESVEGGENIGRFSFIGYNPFMIFTIDGKKFTITARHPDVTTFPSLVSTSMDPLEALKTIFAHCRAVPVEGLPRFAGGAVGYFGYETVQLIEKIPSAATDELRMHDAILMFFDTLLVFDSVRRNVLIVANCYINDPKNHTLLREEYEKAREELRRMKQLLNTAVSPEDSPSVSLDTLQSSVTREDYCRIVDKAKNYIVEGDIFQVVPSQRLQVRFNGNAFDIYRVLRRINPSPYLYYLRLDDIDIIGSSPELLVRVENRIVETRPIAGTRPRGKTPEEDTRIEHELLADQKERAEHLMLVDLGRNDIGRISEYGSVVVDEFMRIEKYSHVMHIVSNIKGKLKQSVSALDALFSCFPAGTVSGAPKIRAMEIIAELEQMKRGVYGGAVGYLDFSGNLDSCIAIRTIVIKNGLIYFQAGGGVVYDSVPETEYQETLDKMSATIQAVFQLKNAEERR